jgi:uncharacterized membrane protein
MKDEMAGDRRRAETPFIHNPDPSGHGASYDTWNWLVGRALPWSNARDYSSSCTFYKQWQAPAFIYTVTLRDAADCRRAAIRSPLYALHPAVVHFPIALLLLNLALTLHYVRTRDRFIERAAYGALVLGWWGALAAIATGTLAVVLVWPLRPGVLAWLNAHAAFGFALLLVYGRALLWRRRMPNVLEGPERNRYILVLLAGALLVAIDGWIGGHLVYRLGLGVER